MHVDDLVVFSITTFIRERATGLHPLMIVMLITQPNLLLLCKHVHIHVHAVYVQYALTQLHCLYGFPFPHTHIHTHIHMTNSTHNLHASSRTHIHAHACTHMCTQRRCMQMYVRQPNMASSLAHLPHVLMAHPVPSLSAFL